MMNQAAEMNSYHCLPGETLCGHTNVRADQGNNPSAATIGEIQRTCKGVQLKTHESIQSYFLTVFISLFLSALAFVAYTKALRTARIAKL